MNQLEQALLITALAWIGTVQGEADLPPGSVARLGSNHMAHLDRIRNLSFSPEGSTILAFEDDCAILWDVETAERIGSFPIEANQTAVFSEDGYSVEIADLDPPRRLVFGDRAHARRWNELDQSLLLPLKIDKYEFKIAAACFSPDMTSVVVAFGDKSIGIYDVDGKSDPVTLEGGKGFQPWFSFSPDGKQVAGSCECPVAPGRVRSTLRVWDVKTGLVVNDIRADSNHGAYTADGKWIVTCGLGTVKIFDVATGELVRQVVENNEHTNLVAFSPDGARLATAQGKRIRIWDTETWQEKLPASAHHEEIHAIAFSPDGRTIVTGGQDGRMIQWSWPDGTERSRIENVGSSWGVDHITYSPDGRYLGVCAWINYKQPFSVIDAATWRVLARFGEGENGGRTPIVFRSGGQQLLTGQGDGSIAIWETITGNLVRKVGTHQDKTFAVAIPSASNETAWWAGGYQGLALRDLETGEDLRVLEGGHHHDYNSVELSSDGRFLAVGGQVWSIETGENLLEFYNSDDAVFSPDGRLLAIGMGDHVELWEPLSESIIHTIGKGDGEVNDLAFSPDGTVLAAAGDGSALIWDLTGVLQNRALPQLQFTDAELDALWEALGSEEDAWSAHLAAWKLAAAGDSGVGFLRQHLRRAAPAERERLEELRSKFTDANFDVRDLAARELLDLGIELTVVQIEGLRRPDHFAISSDLVLSQIPPEEMPRKPPPRLYPLPKRLGETRALKALENSPSASAHTLVRELAEGDPNAPLTNEAKLTWARMTE